jgi:hypothetical protein
MACGDLILSSVLDCANPLQGGVGGNSRAVLIQKSDIDSVTYSNDGGIASITLKAGKSAYSIDGIKQSLKPKYEKTNTDAGQTVYIHTADFFYFEYTQSAKNNIQRMGNGRYVCIFQNAKQDESAFEVLGLDVGLEVTEMMRAPQENGGAVKIILASPEGEFESKLPPTFYATSFSTTLGLIDGLLYLPTITSFTPTAATAAGGTAITVTGTNFYGNGVGSAVTKVQWVNTVTGALVNQTFTVASNTSISMSTVAMAAGAYKLRVTSTKGVAESTTILIVT